jgi:hypothetical protein
LFLSPDHAAIDDAGAVRPVQEEGCKPKVEEVRLISRLVDEALALPFGEVESDCVDALAEIVVSGQDAVPEGVDRPAEIIEMDGRRVLLE